MKCDKEGVPLLIQSMKYTMADMMVEATLFSGAYLRVPVELLADVDMMQDHPTTEQWREIESNLSKLAVDRWSTLGLREPCRRML